MLILRWILNALILLLITRFLPGFSVDGFWGALLVALVLGIVNALIRPVLLLLTLPITILTLGLFSFVINAVMILLVAKLVPGFTVDSFSTAFIAGLILWLISWLTNALLAESIS